MEKAYVTTGLTVERFCGRFWCNQHKLGKVRSTDENIRLEIPLVNEYIERRHIRKIIINLV
jgi:hypothetical protein